ncbi:rhodanese-like domain-containing protein [Saliphagus sp. LR7]|uniref:rhodanese-like domain-containing protein n=1 Tax=Saliphagus sp. LR7 TaxID=2282654 RepID=UPI000DF753CC|nr:rhodanese-like domain-containing protein [Saliphagus sp. LR7]
MNRRTFLAVGGAAAMGGVAGCLGGNGGGDNGTPANEFDYETITTDGTDVPLAPVTDVYEWYENGEAEFVDARGRAQYDGKRIAGAVWSRAPDGVDDDPVEEWATDTRIVTYCGCPHHLSSQRAASLIDAGYEHAYAIDEGLGGWENNGYPLEGTDVEAERVTYEIRGTASTEYAGEMVTMKQVGVDRREAAPIGDDGSYALQLHYAGSTEDRFRVEAPEYTAEGTLAELTGGVVTA